MRGSTRRRRAGLAGLPVLALLLAAGAPDARAHGGQYRPPGGGTPPGTSAPSGPPTVITPGDTWQTWWDLNRLGVLPSRDEAARRRVVTPSGEAPRTPEEEAVAWASRRVEATRTSVLPFLLRCVDPRRKTPDEVRAAALIAIGKIGQDRVHVPLLLGALQDPQAPALVRESAALALGLLRRSDPALRLPGGTLDRIRERLLDVFDDRDAPDSARVFAVLAIGLLGDQPFGEEATKAGRAASEALWTRLGGRYAAADLPTALLTALGMQPPEGVPDEVRVGLDILVSGRSVLDRTWDGRERSHALTAALRLGTPGARVALRRALLRSREDVEVRRAACLAVGRAAAGMPETERLELMGALARVVTTGNDALTTGFGLLALGHLLGAQARSGNLAATEATEAARLLTTEAERGTGGARGFAVLGLAFAAQGARGVEAAVPLLASARALLFDGLLRARGDDGLRAAYAVGAGILGMQEAVDALRAHVDDLGAGAVLRGHAAVSLGQIGRNTEAVRESLLALLGEEKGAGLRVQAATALALLGGRIVRTRLLAELDIRWTEYRRSHALIALGYLGDLAAVPDLLGFAADEGNSDLSRALAIAALGILTDPEPRPSIHLLTQDANYPATTGLVYAAFAIF